MELIQGKTNGEVAVERESCGSCRFFNEPAGECHKNPPGWMPVHAETLAGQKTLIQSVWPPTRAGNWCGAHEGQKPA